MLETVVDLLTPLFRDWGLLIIFAATFLESSILIASVLPGESVLLLGGVYASSNAPFLDGADPALELGAVIMVAFLGAVLGDIVGYWIGRVAGRSIVRSVGRFFFLPESRLPILESYFERYGMRAVLFGRFAPFLRSARTLVAGIARMDFPRFVIPDLLGAAMWASAVAVIGFLLAESWQVANSYLGAFGFVVFLGLALLFLLTWRRVRARVEQEFERERPADGPRGR